MALDKLNDVSRRDFLRTTALVTASAAVGHPATLSGETAAQDAAMPEAKPVDMGAVFPAGAVYFRKSNPPREDWAANHKTAAQIGMNTFRHWFMWSAIEVEPGKYDWADYDRMMDLAADNGIKVVVAELVTAAPEWMFRMYPQARYLGSDYSVIDSQISGSSDTGGFPGLCLDNPEVKAHAEQFLIALIERYRTHRALLGFDLWNETTYEGGTPQRMYCFCEASKKKFREWVQARYGTLDVVRKTWQRYSTATWEDVNPPRNFSGYPESLDWLQFRVDNAYALFDWRIKLVKEHDPKHLVICHGVAGTLESHASSTHQEWLAAKRVDVYGVTFIAARKGSEPWKQYQAFDLVRAGSRGKPFWHAEATGGPLWLQPQVIGRPREDGRVSTPEDVRLWGMVSCAAGSRGVMYTRWRGLLDGPLFGAFGLFAMDGSMTPQAEMAGRMMRWANASPDVFRSRPIRGEVGLLFAPESELFNYVQQGSTDFYSSSMKGAYQAFFDSNIQPDFVALADIAEYKLLYVAFPVMLRAETVARLKRYVTDGGTLICEGLPGYFGDNGHVGTVQPNYGLDELFGVKQSYVEFDPDICENLMLEVNGSKVYGRYFRQEYELNGGTAVGHFESGAIAAVTHTMGRGRTMLIGTFPGGGYFLHHGAETKAMFAGFLKMAGIVPQVRVDDAAVTARVHQGRGGTYLWVTNPTMTARDVKVSIEPGVSRFSKGEDVWGKQPTVIDGQRVSIHVPGKDAAVVLLR